MDEVNISSALFHSFKVKENWYEVFYGSVRMVIDYPHKRVRIIIEDWRSNPDIVNALKEIGF